VPLSRPALRVAAGARGLQEARRWVVDAVHEIGRPELAEAVELGVSELVTNAVLHAVPPIEVRVRGTRRHPRVEVRDGSPEPPQMPILSEVTGDPADLDEDDLLVTFGRGLDIVARSADAWGAEIEDAGKVVWFTPASELRDVGVPGTVTGLITPVGGSRRADTRAHLLLGVPLDSLLAFRRHYQELRREVRLLALAHEDEYPLARQLSDLFWSMQRELRDGIGTDVRELRPRRDGTVDLTVHLTSASAVMMGRFVELLDFADEFCSRERMLSLARTPEQRAFQTWFLTELVRQQAGRSPQPLTAQPDHRAQA
jgi:anti-sigma regulatory factor (Ser/Thr protein kinase)